MLRSRRDFLVRLGILKKAVTPEAHFATLFEELHTLCAHQGWGEPFSYSRAREIHMANTLGHKIAPSLSGADAYEDAEMTIPVEYKSTISKKGINASYSGLSVKPTWEEQIQYLKKEKIGKYPRHYFALYDGWKIAEIWCMECDLVLAGLLPALKRQFNRNNRADPRLGASLSKKYITQNATKIL